MNNGTVFWGDFKRNKAFDGACKLTALSHDVLLSHCTVFQDVYYILSQLKFQRQKKKKKKYVFQENTTTGDILGSSSESTVQILLH